MNMLALQTRRGPALRLVANLAVFQLAWFACVMLAARNEPWAAAGSAWAAVALHFAFSERPRADALLLAACLAIGVAWDSLLSSAGIVHYAASDPASLWAPAWIIAMWALFATTLREPLRWMHKRLFVAALFGGIGGPMSYLAASRLGACTFADPKLAMLVLGAGWAVFTPLLMRLAQVVDKDAQP